MLNWFRKRKENSNNPLDELRTEFKVQFFSSPHHRWILKDKSLYRAFEGLIDSFSEDIIQFHKRERILFLVSNGEMACALSQLQGHHVILVFKDLVKILRSGSSDRGLAVLAHEIGHVYYRHSERQVSIIQSQSEADRFAFDLGFGHALLDFLLEYSGNEETEVRARLLADAINAKEESVELDH